MDSMSLLQNIRDRPEATEDGTIPALLDAVGREGKWPENEPGVTVQSLVQQAIEAGQQLSSESPLGNTLLRLVTETAWQEVAERNPLRVKGHKAVVAELLQVMENDLQARQQGETADRGAFVAMILAAAMGALRSRAQRKRFVRLVLSLSKCPDPGEYSNPFLVDRAVLYRRMQLERLDKLNTLTIA